MKNRFTRILLISCGTLSVGLAVLGMFIPVLPTTPFLLLAAFCYARSSPRFYNWLIHNRWLGAYLRNYHEGRGMPLKHKVITIALLWLSIIAALVLVVAHWWLVLLLVGIAGGVTIHLVKIKTADENCPPALMIKDPVEPDETG